MSCTANYLKKMIEFQKNKEETEKYMNELINDQTDAIVNISQSIGDEIMSNQHIKQMELYTVISLKDNPNLNLEVAQPSKYKVENTFFGKGILCYKKNALKILKSKLEPYENIIKVTININQDTLLNLCETKDKEYIKQVYNTISDKSQISTDADLINYVCIKGNKHVDIIATFMILGSPIYEGSTIADYMDMTFLLRNTKTIIKAEKVSIEQRF